MQGRRMVSRRDVLAVAAAACVPAITRAQPARKPLKLAWFSGGTLKDQQPYVEAFRKGMRDLGYVEGRDFSMEYFWRGETIKPFGWLARDVVSSKPDVIMATCEITGDAAKKATQSIPIVLTASSDPVTHGLVSSLGRPGGNVTGISLSLLDVSIKRVEMLKELLPAADRITAVRWRYEQPAPKEMVAIEKAARVLGLAFTVADAEDESDFDRVFAEARKAKVSGMVDMAGLTWSFPYLSLLPELEIKYRMPMVHYVSEIVERGGLISYGPDVADGFRRSAQYVDRVAKGAKAADLPIEQPDKIETWVNLKTARAIGVNVPQSILLRADRVIG